MNDSPELTYLDYAAATPLDEHVLAAMMPYFSDAFYNPSSPYAPALAVRRDYEAAKQQIAAIIGATADELVMTAGATESVNLAFGGVSGHVIATTIEHHSVLAAARQKDHTFVSVDERGRVKLDELRAAIRDDTQLISIALANNEIGTLQPLRDVVEIIRRVREDRRTVGNTTPLYLHSDASQGVGLLDVHVSRLGVDLLTLNAAKVYGPKQVGLLWADRKVALQPQIVGGGQERGLRSGTENVAGTIGFATAITRADKRRKAESERLRALRDSLESKLTEAFPEAVISGHKKHRLPNFLHISWPGIDAERLVFALEMRGVLVATGSACAANKGTRSHVLTAIGLDDQTADGSLRLSLGKMTNEQAVERAVQCIIETVQQEKTRVGK